MNQATEDAVITGGSSGIGLAIARRLCQAGHRVHLVARDAQKLEAAKRELCSEVPQASASVHACDVTNEGAIADLRRALDASGVAPTWLINSAGQSLPGYFAELSATDFESQINVNLYGTVNMVRAFTPGMVHQGRGRVVNVSSVAGLMGVFGYTAYSASKFAVTGFTEALRMELEPSGVGVHLLCPGDTDTPMLAHERARAPKETLALNKNAGILPPDAIAKALLKGIRDERFLIVPGSDARTAATAHRLVPRLVYRIIQRQLRKARA